MEEAVKFLQALDLHGSNNGARKSNPHGGNDQGQNYNNNNWTATNDMFDKSARASAAFNDREMALAPFSAVFVKNKIRDMTGGADLSYQQAANEENAMRMFRIRQRYQFFKTRLCPRINRKLGGVCPNGDNCSYAHSLVELRPPVNLSKTKMCQNYIADNCPLTSERCQFAHGLGELKAARPYYRPPVCKFWQTGSCPDGQMCCNSHDEYCNSHEKLFSGRLAASLEEQGAVEEGGKSTAAGLVSQLFRIPQLAAALEGPSPVPAAALDPTLKAAAAAAARAAVSEGGSGYQYLTEQLCKVVNLDMPDSNFTKSSKVTSQSSNGAFTTNILTSYFPSVSSIQDPERGGTFGNNSSGASSSTELFKHIPFLAKGVGNGNSVTLEESTAHHKNCAHTNSKIPFRSCTDETTRASSIYGQSGDLITSSSSGTGMFNFQCGTLSGRGLSDDSGSTMVAHGGFHNMSDLTGDARYRQHPGSGFFSLGDTSTIGSRQMASSDSGANAANYFGGFPRGLSSSFASPPPGVTFREHGATTAEEEQLVRMLADATKICAQSLLNASAAAGSESPRGIRSLEVQRQLADHLSNIVVRLVVREAVDLTASASPGTLPASS